MNQKEFIEWNEFMESMFLYGTPKPDKEEEKPKARLLGEYTIKLGEEMEIGGNRCHLCGAEHMFGETSQLTLKKHSEHSRHVVYECGTQMLDTYKVKNATGVIYKRDRHIHAECI